MLRKHVILILFILGTSSISAQIIEGTVLNMEDSTAIPHATVVLYDHTKNHILAHTLTNSEGKFTLSYKFVKGVYLLKIRHISFYEKDKPIVIDNSTINHINTTIYLIPKYEQLEEVILESYEPIIIKKDTVIYDVKHWLQERHMTLEDVIKEMDGFSINENGEIKVFGKPVNKILVDGEEISDSDGNVIIQSLDPKKVSKIEVRFDEKENKIKESLLDRQELVVLDIKLKKDFKKSFFGKIQPTIGYRTRPEIGGFLNLFSLKKHTKLHLFAEHDAFGNQTIPIRNVKNLGQEAQQKNMELPLDYNEITKKEGYHNALFGFRDYSFFKRKMLGFSGKIDITDKSSIYMGSYNYMDNQQKEIVIREVFYDNEIYHFIRQIHRNVISSKNKIQWRYDSNKSKFKYDINYVFLNNSLLLPL